MEKTVRTGTVDQTGRQSAYKLLYIDVLDLVYYHPREEAWYGGRHALDARKKEGNHGVVDDIIHICIDSVASNMSPVGSTGRTVATLL